jgi:hypothetical protein
MRPKAIIHSWKALDTYVELALEEATAAGFKSKFLERGDPYPRWSVAKGATLTPPEIQVSTELDYPFDPDRQMREIVDWLLSCAHTLHLSLSMVLHGNNKCWTFRPVVIKYGPNKVMLTTDMSMCIY